jgi:hypothetical protein
MYRIALSAILIALVLLPTEAQVRRRGERWQIEETTRIINDCEKRTNAFKGILRHAINESRLDHSRREQQLNRDADRLEDAMDHVGDSWNRDHNPGKTRWFVSEAIAVSKGINKTMMASQSRGGEGVERREGGVEPTGRNVRCLPEKPRSL